MAGDSFEELRVVWIGCADVFKGFNTFGGVAPAAAVFVGDDELVLVVSEAALEGELGIRKNAEPTRGTTVFMMVYIVTIMIAKRREEGSMLRLSMLVGGWYHL